MGRTIDLLVNFLVEEWRKHNGAGSGDNFMFDEKSKALDTLQRAVDFHTEKAHPILNLWH